MAQVGQVKQGGASNEAAARARLRRLLPPVVGGVLLMFALIGFIGTAIKDPHPHDIPVGLVGPAPAVQQMSAAFGTNAPGAFQFTTYGSEADGRSALDSRAVDGLLVLGGSSPRLVVAAAEGDASIGVITAAFTNAFAAQGATVAVETVHPFASGDAHGLILFFVVVATLVCSLVVQALMLARVRGATFAERVGVVIGFGVLAGLVGMGTAAWIADGYGSGFWLAAAMVALASAAVGAVVAGLVRLIGPAGLGLAGLGVVLLGLVTSGGPVGSLLLPDFYRALAPWMPAGPLYSGIRGALYFDGAGVAEAAAVLAGWLVAGLILMGLGEMRSASRARTASGTVAG
jgi:hypothetical protein